MIIQKHKLLLNNVEQYLSVSVKDKLCDEVTNTSNLYHKRNHFLQYLLDKSTVTWLQLEVSGRGSLIDSGSQTDSERIFFRNSMMGFKQSFYVMLIAGRHCFAFAIHGQCIGVIT